MELYMIQSLETHLFFARIMKEHSLFLEVSFPAREERWISRARYFREEWEAFLADVVRASGGNIRQAVLDSGEVVTPFTLFAERKTAQYTCVPIDSEITLAEQRLVGLTESGRHCEMVRFIRALNQRALRLLSGLIRLKEEILAGMLSCQLYTTNYPLLIQHIMREAKLYQSFLMHLERTGRLCTRDMQELEVFWNQIMMEHAQFIRGLLDPTEEAFLWIRSTRPLAGYL